MMLKFRTIFVIVFASLALFLSLFGLPINGNLFSADVGTTSLSTGVCGSLYGPFCKEINGFDARTNLNIPPSIRTPSVPIQGAALSSSLFETLSQLIAPILKGETMVATIDEETLRRTLQHINAEKASQASGQNQNKASVGVGAQDGSATDMRTKQVVGSFKMAGVYDLNGLKLLPTEWIQRPSEEWTSPGISGKLKQQDTLSIQLTDPEGETFLAACKNFVAKLVTTSTSAKPVNGLDGIWRGQYVCNGIVTDMILEIETRMLKDKIAELEATFKFTANYASSFKGTQVFSLDAAGNRLFDEDTEKLLGQLISQVFFDVQSNNAGDNKYQQGKESDDEEEEENPES